MDLFRNQASIAAAATVTVPRVAVSRTAWLGDAVRDLASVRSTSASVSQRLRGSEWQTDEHWSAPLHVLVCVTVGYKHHLGASNQRTNVRTYVLSQHFIAADRYSTCLRLCITILYVPNQKYRCRLSATSEYSSAVYMHLIHSSCCEITSFLPFCVKIIYTNKSVPVVRPCSAQYCLVAPLIVLI